MLDRQSSLQRRCVWLRRLASALAACFFLVLGLEAALAFRSENMAVYFAETVAERLPVLFYLVGVWTIRSSFARLAHGDLFGEVLPVLIRRLGWSLAAGGFASVFLTQWFLRALHRSAEGPWATFDPSAITVGLVGLLLIVLADLIRRAETMRQELDEFF